MRRRDRQPPAVARLTLTPQKREFFDLYNQAAANIVASPSGVSSRHAKCSRLLRNGDVKLARS